MTATIAQVSSGEQSLHNRNDLHNAQIFSALAAAREHMSNVAEEAAEEAAKLADSQHLSPSQGAASDGAIQMNS